MIDKITSVIIALRTKITSVIYLDVQTTIMETEILIGRIRAAQTEIAGAISELSEAEATQILVNAEWSIKDLLAHLAVWLEKNAMELQRIKAGTWQPQPMEMEKVHQHNRATVLDSRAKSFANIRREYEAISTEIRRHSEELPSEIAETSPIYRVLNSAARHLTHHARQFKTLETTVKVG